MPMPKQLARLNKHTFNRWELKKGERPVLHHVGRVSGTEYFTPLDAHEVDGGYIFVVMYGADCDWVQNVLASGSARLTIGGETIELVAPRIESTAEARTHLAATTKAPPGFARVDEYLHMDFKSWWQRDLRLRSCGRDSPPARCRRRRLG